MPIVVEIKFISKELEKLYTSGKSKKYRLQPNVLQSFFEVLASCEASKDIYDLWNEPSLNFKKMRGYQDRFSLRITRKFRLEVEIDWEDSNKIVGTMLIDKISTHYQ